MTTTSYAISKQLHEAGFKAKTDTLIQEKIFDQKYPSYHLETILNAIPKTLDSTEGCPFLFIEFLLGGSIGYMTQNMTYLFKEDQEEDESLADTAARLLLNLIGKGIIKTGEKV